MSWLPEEKRLHYVYLYCLLFQSAALYAYMLITGTFMPSQVALQLPLFHPFIEAHSHTNVGLNGCWMEIISTKVLVHLCHLEVKQVKTTEPFCCHYREEEKTRAHYFIITLYFQEISFLIIKSDHSPTHFLLKSRPFVSSQPFTKSLIVHLSNQAS